MDKEKYNRSQLDITEFQKEDIIVTSELDEYEDDIIRPNR